MISVIISVMSVVQHVEYKVWGSMYCATDDNVVRRVDKPTHLLCLP